MAAVRNGIQAVSPIRRIEKPWTTFKILRDPEDVEVPGRIAEDLGQSELPKKSRSHQGFKRETVRIILLPLGLQPRIKAEPCRQPDQAK